MDRCVCAMCSLQPHTFDREERHKKKRRKIKYEIPFIVIYLRVTKIYGENRSNELLNAKISPH